MVKSCKGCRFRLVRRLTALQSVCMAHDGEIKREWVSPHDGRRTVYYGLRPTIDEERAEGRPCGPEAKLFQPTIWRRLFGK